MNPSARAVDHAASTAAAAMPGAPSPRLPVLLSIQYLRGLAAAAVVVFHAGYRFHIAVPIGEAGVDLFFVISGFIMFSITSAATRPLAFAKNRIIRIVPPYWIATSVLLAGGLAGLFPNLPRSVPNIIASYLFIAWPSPAWVEPWPLLVPGWTLNYEMLFYVIFTAALVLPRRLQPAIVVGTLAALVLAARFVPPSHVVAVFYTRPILLEFGAGVLLAAWWRRAGGPPAVVGWLLAAAGAIGFVVAAVWGSAAVRVLWFGVPALLFMFGVLSIEHRAAAFARLPALRLVGDASYSIYLWHTLAISLVVGVARRVGVSAPFGMGIAIVVGIAVGIAAHLLIEKPLLALFKRPARRQPLPISDAR